MSIYQLSTISNIIIIISTTISVCPRIPGVGAFPYQLHPVNQSKTTTDSPAHPHIRYKSINMGNQFS